MSRIDKIISLLQNSSSNSIDHNQSQENIHSISDVTKLLSSEQINFGTKKQQEYITPNIIVERKDKKQKTISFANKPIVLQNKYLKRSIKPYLKMSPKKGILKNKLSFFTNKDEQTPKIETIQTPNDRLSYQRRNYKIQQPEISPQFMYFNQESNFSTYSTKAAQIQSANKVVQSPQKNTQVKRQLSSTQKIKNHYFDPSYIIRIPRKNKTSKIAKISSDISSNNTTFEKKHHSFQIRSISNISTKQTLQSPKKVNLKLKEKYQSNQKKSIENILKKLQQKFEISQH